MSNKTPLKDDSKLSRNSDAGRGAGQTLGLTFGARRRMLPTVLETLALSFLTLPDLCALFMTSKAVSQTVVRALHTMKTLSEEQFGREDDDNAVFSLLLVARHCASLSTVIMPKDWLSFRYGLRFVEHVLASNKASLTRFTPATAWCIADFDALLQCPRLQYLACDDDGSDVCVPSLCNITSAGLPQLTSLSMYRRLTEIQLACILQQGIVLSSFVVWHGVCRVSTDRASSDRQRQQHFHVSACAAPVWAAVASTSCELVARLHDTAGRAASHPQAPDQLDRGAR